MTRRLLRAPTRAPRDAALELHEQGKAREVLSHAYDARDRDVLVQFPVGTLGDSIGWLSYAAKFQERHGCRLTCCLSPALIPLFRDAYPHISRSSCALLGFALRHQLLPVLRAQSSLAGFVASWLAATTAASVCVVTDEVSADWRIPAGSGLACRIVDAHRPSRAEAGST